MRPRAIAFEVMALEVPLQYKEPGFCELLCSMC